MPRKFFVGGNFKMNPESPSASLGLISNLTGTSLDPNAEVVISPPALYLLSMKEKVPKGVEVSAQNCYFKDSGAFTGEISALQLKNAGIPWVILGHSERRTLFNESSSLVAQKTTAALAHGISVILCIGETLEEREAEKTKEVCEEQLKPVVEAVKDWSKIVVAYEPVWAIGTGKVATPQQAQDAHKDIRTFLEKAVSAKVADETRILYGGSVNAKNCKELAGLPDVDGFLVGGASLKPEFAEIINAKKA